MPIVYLDQNKWIQLAKAALGRESSRALRDALQIVRATSSLRIAEFPLSLAHHMETRKHRGPRRRLELAKFMFDISAGSTLVGLESIVTFEVSSALATAFPGRIDVAGLSLLGRGVSHAIAKPPATSWVLNDAEEFACLSGIDVLTGLPMPALDLSNPDKEFVERLRRLQQSTAPKSDVERAIHAGELGDVWPTIEDVLARNRVSLHEFATLGESRWCSLMDEMPLSRVNMHLVRQWAKNPSLPSTESTLNDWGYLGAAVQYADIVVTEKLFADIVHREGFRPRARIITDLEELPAVLLDSLGYAGLNEWPQLEA